MESKIWCFVGIDGSGKSTQANLLSEYLRNRKVPAAYIWVRWEPVLLKPFYWILKGVLLKRKQTGHETINSDEYKKLKSFKQKVLKSTFVKTVWLLTAAVDYYLQVIIKVFPKMFSGKVIICDRYFYDFLADQFVNLDLSAEQEKKLYLFIKRMFPEPVKVIYIYIEPGESLKRRNDIPGIEYACDRKQKYSGMAKIDRSWTVLDGDRPKEQIFCEITDLFEEMKGCCQ